MLLIGLLLGGLLLQSASSTPAQMAPQDTAELSGRLIDALSGQPIAGATVRLLSTRRPPAPPRSVRSDGSGRFVFSALAAGQYNFSVNRSGVLTTLFGTDQRRITPTIGDGAVVDLGDIRMPAGVPITGQILDDAGNPLKGAVVAAWRMRYLNPGERQLSAAGTATSSETGDYRIDALPPGTYFVSANSTTFTAPTFFPSTATATEAAPITVTATVGANASIRLLTVPLSRVSGRIVNARGVPSKDFAVLLAPVRDDGAQVSSAKLMSEAGADGHFSIEQVPPGNYNVEAVSIARLESIASSGSSVGVRAFDEAGSARVTVDGHDIDDVFIRTQTATPLSGRILLDGSRIPAEMAARLTVRIGENSGFGSISSVMNASFATPDADGAFTIPAVPGGRLLRVSGLPSGVVLKRVSIRDADVTETGFDVMSSPITDVIVELTSKPAVLSGRVVDDRGVPIGGAGVIVYSTDPSRWRLLQTRVVVASPAKADGTFSFAGLPAGSYYIAGVLELVDGDWAEPANLERLRAAAQTFKLADGQTKDLTVTMKK